MGANDRDPGSWGILGFKLSFDIGRSTQATRENEEFDKSLGTVLGHPRELFVDTADDAADLEVEEGLNFRSGELVSWLNKSFFR